MNKVSKIFLFTVSACALGRTMGTVMQELEQTYASIEFKTFYVDVHIEVANDYRVKAHPTTMFLDQEGNELYRIETFEETGEIIDLINQLNKRKNASTKSYEKNQMSNETYIIYLLQNDAPVPIEVPYLNKTSISAPRITAITLLLNTRLEGYENPFPLSTKLELVKFSGQMGDVTLKMSEEDILKIEIDKMELVLKETLSHYGILEVRIVYTSPLIS